MTIRDALPDGPLGFGTAPLGNMFRRISDDEAARTLAAAWDAGVRYFDTAPLYGAGLAEQRLGRELAKHPRDGYLLSTKVGRVVLDEAAGAGAPGRVFEYGRPNKVVFDYTAAGVERSIEGSRARLGVDRIDFVWIHDLAQDALGDAWVDQFAVAHQGAMRALTRLREQGVIRGWGLGVNRVEPIELALGLEDVHPDAMLLAGRYTLLDHALALQRLLPAASRRGVQLVIGGPYSSGVLVGGSHFEYAPASTAILARVQKLQELARRHDIPVKAAALQFPLAHPAVAAVIPGASRPERIMEDQRALKVRIPPGFWQDLRRERLVSPDAPLPIDAARGA